MSDKVDKDLIKLYSFESVHNTPDEKALADWIEEWLVSHKISYTRDGDNFYRLDQLQEPILSAHLDQVKTNGKAEHFYLTPEKHIVAYNKDWEQTSLGGDDKNGVWIILKMLEKELPINFIISAGEEVGCVGIKKLEDHKILDQIEALDTWCIVLDRRGSDDVLDSGSGSTYCKTLAQDICNYLGDMSVTSGSVSDTATICEYCESVNMSVAYEKPHSAQEHTDWIRLQCICDYVEQLCTDFVHYPTSPSVYVKKTWYNSYTGYGKKGKDYEKDYDSWEDRYAEIYGR